MTFAVAAVALVAGAWFGIRWNEESQRLDELIATIASTPLPTEEFHPVLEPGWWN